MLFCCRNGKRNNRAGTRGKSGKIPDDYYFAFTEGTFKLKEPSDAGIAYEYVPDLGVWKHPEEPDLQKARAENQSYSAIPAISDYYFDKEVCKHSQYMPKRMINNIYV